MKVRDLRKALKNVPGDLEVVLNNLRDGDPLSPDAFEAKKAGVVSESGLWERGFWIEIGPGFKY